MRPVKNKALMVDIPFVGKVKDKHKIIFSTKGGGFPLKMKKFFFGEQMRAVAKDRIKNLCNSLQEKLNTKDFKTIEILLNKIEEENNKSTGINAEEVIAAFSPLVKKELFLKEVAGLEHSNTIPMELREVITNKLDKKLYKNGDSLTDDQFKWSIEKLLENLDEDPFSDPERFNLVNKSSQLIEKYFENPSSINSSEDADNIEKIFTALKTYLDEKNLGKEKSKFLRKFIDNIEKSIESAGVLKEALRASKEAKIKNKSNLAETKKDPRKNLTPPTPIAGNPGRRNPKKTEDRIKSPPNTSPKKNNKSNDNINPTPNIPSDPIGKPGDKILVLAETVHPNLGIGESDFYITPVEPKVFGFNPDLKGAILAAVNNQMFSGQIAGDINKFKALESFRTFMSSPDKYYGKPRNPENLDNFVDYILENIGLLRDPALTNCRKGMDLLLGYLQSNEKSRFFDDKKYEDREFSEIIKAIPNHSDSTYPSGFLKILINYIRKDEFDNLGYYALSHLTRNTGLISSITKNIPSDQHKLIFKNKIKDLEIKLKDFRKEKGKQDIKSVHEHRFENGLITKQEFLNLTAPKSAEALEEEARIEKLTIVNTALNKIDAFYVNEESKRALRAFKEFLKNPEPNLDSNDTRENLKNFSVLFFSNIKLLAPDDQKACMEKVDALRGVLLDDERSGMAAIELDTSLSKELAAMIKEWKFNETSGLPSPS